VIIKRDGETAEALESNFQRLEEIAMRGGATRPAGPNAIKKQASKRAGDN